MTDIDKNIVELIRQNQSIRDICTTLNISEKEFYIRYRKIVEYGYQIMPEYHYDGNIYYNIKNKIIELSNNEVNLKMPNTIKEFRCIVISDGHKGNIASDDRYLNEVYEYAIKNNIHIVLICGDMIEGIHSSDRKDIHDMYEQIEEFIDKYPYDKSIMNFGILGNHEHHFLRFDGIDVMKTIMNSRYDIVLVGYGNGIVRLKNDSILLKHNLGNKSEEIENEAKLVLSGHGHMMKTKIYDRLILCVPTLSDVSPDKTKEATPGFIDLKIIFDRGKFDYLEARHLAFIPNIREVSETRTKIKTLFKEI